MQLLFTRRKHHCFVCKSFGLICICSSGEGWVFNLNCFLQWTHEKVWVMKCTTCTHLWSMFSRSFREEIPLCLSVVHYKGGVEIIYLLYSCNYILNKYHIACNHGLGEITNTTLNVYSIHVTLLKPLENNFNI